MNLIPWRRKQEEPATAEPFTTSVARFRDEIDNLFEGLFRDPWWPWGSGAVPGRAGWMPRMDLAESDNEVTVKAELPGIDPKDVEIDVLGNVLTLRGEKKQEQERKEKNYYRVERQYGSFQRSLQLPTWVDTDHVDAEYKNGVLTVKMRKRQDVLPKKIAVRGA